MFRNAIDYLISKKSLFRCIISSTFILILIINLILINTLGSQHDECKGILIQGKVISVDKCDYWDTYPDQNHYFVCDFKVNVIEVIRSNIGTFPNVAVGKDIRVYYSSDSAKPIDVRVGDCVEVCARWDGDLFVGDSEYVEKIDCPTSTPTPSCSSGPIGSPQCSGNEVRQLYQDANCDQYWQTIDDCNRYIPSKCCNNGYCDSCGSQETYRCVNNVVQRLIINNGVEEWQVFDDCNSYDPPRRCIGGVCIESNDPTPEEECDQSACQEQNGPVGDSYLRDGRIYQRYNECNCFDSECQCSVLEKEEIKFIGTYISELKLIGGRTDIIKIDNVEQGPQISGTIGMHYWISVHPDKWVAGERDAPLKKGDKVKVYAIYEGLSQNPTAFGDHEGTIIGDKKYYIRKHCDQQSCQAQSKPLMGPYTKPDGKMYQQFSECNCRENICRCEEVERETSCDYEFLSPPPDSRFRIFSINEIPIKVKSKSMMGGQIIATLRFESELENIKNDKRIILEDENFDGIYEYTYNIKPVEDRALDIINKAIEENGSNTIYDTLRDFVLSVTGTYTIILPCEIENKNDLDRVAVTSKDEVLRVQADFDSFIYYRYYIDSLEKCFTSPINSIFTGRIEILTEVEKCIQDITKYLTEDNEHTVCLNTLIGLDPTAVLPIYYGYALSDILEDFDKDKANEVRLNILKDIIFRFIPDESDILTLYDIVRCVFQLMGGNPSDFPPIDFFMPI